MTKRSTALMTLVFALIYLVSGAHAKDHGPMGILGAHAKDYGPWGIDLEAMDRSIDPRTDFNGFVNGTWERTTQIPPDKTRIGSFDILDELSKKQVRSIIENWAASENSGLNSDEEKVASLYRTFLNEENIEALGKKPIEPNIQAIVDVENHEELASFMASSFYNFGHSFFGISISPDAKDPKHYAVYLSQSGISLPDRNYYLEDKFKETQERYKKYIQDMLELVGWDEPEKNAAAILGLEKQIAEAHWTRAESRDRDKTYNPLTLKDLEKEASEFPWQVFFKAVKLGDVNQFILRQNTAVAKLAKIYRETPLSTLKAWSAFYVVEQAAGYLSSSFVRTKWEFRSHFLDGAQEQSPRWKRAISVTEGLMGEVIGKAYVAEYFPPESKLAMEALVGDLLDAFQARIEKLSWMSPETKEQALKKLALINVKIGYPSKWRDYSTLHIEEGDLVGNVLRGALFDWNKELGNIGQEVDKEEWGMNPQTVNAYYNPSLNEIVFPAAILQPPFFNPLADAAVNYGGIGAVIGHEMTHGFDDQGRKSDGSGVLRDWWTPEDAAEFDKRAEILGAQYAALNLPDFPGVHINPVLTMGENIADLGGVILALDAYKLSLRGKTPETLDGFSGNQRLFLGWAQVWRALVRPETQLQLLLKDPHSPPKVRAFASLPNCDEWYEAFGVQVGDALFISPENRVRIW